MQNATVTRVNSISTGTNPDLTPSPPTNNAQPQSSSSGGVSAGVIAGAVIGAVVAISLILGIIFFVSPNSALSSKTRAGLSAWVICASLSVSDRLPLSGCLLACFCHTSTLQVPHPSTRYQVWQWDPSLATLFRAGLALANNRDAGCVA